MHRLGIKERINNHEAETFLNLVILQELKNGNPGEINRLDPDVIVAMETIAELAGMTCWTHEDLTHYPWLGIGLMVDD